ncbi:MAG: A24 family peptidase [Eubacteriales bacterium]|nr:A24 family peptidase [Eubacteriales bacterium]MDD4630303.1 A24 family peptidase [Eubacteriales bacterium]
MSIMQVKDPAQAAIFFILLLAASVCDIRKRIIPDELNAMILCTGLLTFAPVKLAGLLLGLPLFIAALLREGGMGGGDIKFTGAAGFVLGFPQGITGLIFGLSAALLYHLIIKSIRKMKHINALAAEETLLPLAPFLSAGFLTAYLINFGGLFL